MHLHWLPVKPCIIYKINLVAYKAQHGFAPDYLKALLVEYQPTRSLRSSVPGKLVEKRFHKKQSGDWAFSVCAPKLWNALPHNVRERTKVDGFKKALKHIYFNKHFTSQYFYYVFKFCIYISYNDVCIVLTVSVSHYYFC